jgi:hypothetical protein
LIVDAYLVQSEELVCLATVKGHQYCKPSMHPYVNSLPAQVHKRHNGEQGSYVNAYGLQVHLGMIA